MTIFSKCICYSVFIIFPNQNNVKNVYFYLKLNSFQMQLLPHFRQKDKTPNTYAPNDRDSKYVKAFLRESSSTLHRMKISGHKNESINNWRLNKEAIRETPSPTSPPQFPGSHILAFWRGASRLNSQWRNRRWRPPMSQEQWTQHSDPSTLCSPGSPPRGCADLS